MSDNGLKFIGKRFFTIITIKLHILGRLRFAWTIINYNYDSTPYFWGVKGLSEGIINYNYNSTPYFLGS